MLAERKDARLHERSISSAPALLRPCGPRSLTFAVQAYAAAMVEWSLGVDETPRPDLRFFWRKHHHRLERSHIDAESGPLSCGGRAYLVDVGWRPEDAGIWWSRQSRQQSAKCLLPRHELAHLWRACRTEISALTARLRTLPDNVPRHWVYHLKRALVPKTRDA